MTKISFGELVELLEAGGFEIAKSHGNHVVLKQDDQGASVILPRYRTTESVRPTHLSAVRHMLISNGIRLRTHKKVVQKLPHRPKWDQLLRYLYSDSAEAV